MPTYANDPVIRRIEQAMPAPLRAGTGEPTERVEQIGGFEVHLDEWHTPGARASVLLLHGGGGHGRLLAPYARMAVRAGAHAIAPDLPGYGLTRVPRKSAIRFEDWRHVASELLAREAAKGLPVIVFGLSMGGMLAYDTVCRTQAAAGLMATCFLDPRRAEVQRGIARWPWLAAFSLPLLRASAPLTDGLILPMRLLAKMQGIANDPALARAIIADKRAGGNAMPLGFLRTYLEAAPLLPPQAFDLCPVTLAHPAEDRWTPPDLSLPFFEALSATKKLVMLEGAGHFPVESPGAKQIEQAMTEMIDRVARPEAVA